MPKSKKNIFNENKEEIILLYNRGFPLLDIEKSFDISRHTIRKYLKEIGIQRSKKETNSIIQKAKEKSLLQKYGVVNISQINDPEMQERRVRGARERGRLNWSGSGNPNYKNKIGNNFGYKSGIREDLKQFFRSSWEANYARYLNYKNIEWKYEPKHFELKGGKTYTPDFYLINEDKFIEIKGYWRDDAKEKFKLFKEQYPEVKIQLIEEVEYKELINENREHVNFEN